MTKTSPDYSQSKDIKKKPFAEQLMIRLAPYLEKSVMDTTTEALKKFDDYVSKLPSMDEVIPDLEAILAQNNDTQEQIREFTHKVTQSSEATNKSISQIRSYVNELQDSFDVIADNISALQLQNEQDAQDAQEKEQELQSQIQRQNAQQEKKASEFTKKLFSKIEGVKGFSKKLLRDGLILVALMLPTILDKIKSFFPMEGFKDKIDKTVDWLTKPLFSWGKREKQIGLSPEEQQSIAVNRASDEELESVLQSEASSPALKEQVAKEVAVRAEGKDWWRAENNLPSSDTESAPEWYTPLGQSVPAAQGEVPSLSDIAAPSNTVSNVTQVNSSPVTILQPGTNNF